MFEVQEFHDRIEFRFETDINHVNRVIEENHIFFHQVDIGISELSNLNLVLRELLNNAVEHGNKEIRDKRIHCIVEHLGKKRFKIIVEDEGNGFDYSQIDWEIPMDPRQTRNRGFALINTFSDQIKFNEKGNQITVFMSLSREIEFQIKQDGEFRVVIPSGDLTASSEKKFRALLESLLEEGIKSFRFDFSKVDDIDSVSLSVLIVFSKLLSKKQNGKLEIINLNEDLRNLLKLTRVDRIFKIIE